MLWETVMDSCECDDTQKAKAGNASCDLPSQPLSEAAAHWFTASSTWARHIALARACRRPGAIDRRI